MADADKRPRDLLGGGGSNYSTKKGWQLAGSNGLRTGQYSGEHLLVGAYVNSSYSTMLNNTSLVSNRPGGYAVGGGLVFEYQHLSFIMQIGAGLRFQDVCNNVVDTSFMKYNVADSWTNRRDTFRYDLQYDFYRRKDRSRMLYIEVPVLFGCTFGGYSPRGRGYFLAGPRFQYGFKGNTSVEAAGNTQGYYDRYFGVQFKEECIICGPYKDERDPGARKAHR